MRHAAFPLFSALALSTSASAQLINPDFDTGTLAPWTVQNTPQGQSVATAVVPYDIDGPGPCGVSPAARFMAGQQAPNSGPQGVVIQQTAWLYAGPYVANLNWATHALITTNVSSGIFEILVDGVVIASESAPVLAANQRAYGLLYGSVGLGTTGWHSIAIRITRPITAGAEVWQYLDNLDVVESCDPDYNQDGSVDQDDVSYLINLIAGGNNPTGRNPDFNRDGNADQEDVASHINTIAGGPCP